MLTHNEYARNRHIQTIEHGMRQILGVPKYDYLLGHTTLTAHFEDARIKTR